MSQQEKAFISLAGEFLVAGELNRRCVAASITYGPSKSADIFAFSRDSKRLSRIEVKATVKSKWPVGKRALAKETAEAGIFWVLVLLPLQNNSPRYFVLTGQEVFDLATNKHNSYLAKFEQRRGKPFEGPGVPTLTLSEVTPFENRWSSILTYLDKG